MNHSMNYSIGKAPQVMSPHLLLHVAGADRLVGGGNISFLPYFFFKGKIQK